jgi:hypothetical protein
VDVEEQTCEICGFCGIVDQGVNSRFRILLDSEGKIGLVHKRGYRACETLWNWTVLTLV